jgi:hypothetical protein
MTMEYGRAYKSTVVPVDIAEGEEGLIKVTEFNEIIPFTLRALLKGYKCTDEMLDRVESRAQMMSVEEGPVEFFITYNPHCFAACITNTNKGLHLAEDRDILTQNEIMDLIESLPGSLKRSGTYQYLRSIDEKNKKIRLKTRMYETPIFDISLRYLSVSKYKHSVDTIVEQRHLMVLYIP